MWATPLATRREKPVYELLASALGPGGRFGPAIIVDPNIGEATGTSSDLAISSTGQADVVYRAVETDSPRCPCCARATSSSRYGWRTSTVSAGRTWGRSTATRASRCARRPKPTRPRSDRPDRQRGGRLAGARHRRRGADLGQALVWLDARLRAAGHPRNVHWGADLDRRRRAQRGRRTGWGRPTSPTARTPARASPLPGPRIFLNILPNGESKSGGEFEGPTIADGGARRPVGLGRAAEHRHRRKGRPAAAVRRQRHPARDRGRRPWADGGVVAGIGVRGLGTVLRERHEQQGGGVSAWPSARRPRRPGRRGARGLPSGAVQTALVSGGAGGEVGDLAVGRSGPATAWSPSARVRSATRRSSPRRSPRRPPNW